jgi:ubiquinone/menaquinone biosynthesis C-methylase UbiE
MLLVVQIFMYKPKGRLKNMNDKGSWGKERAEAFARPIQTKAGSIYAALARKIANAMNDTDGDPTLLDLGCGPGMLIVEIKRLLPQVRVIGIDPSEHMLKIARKRVEKSDFPDIEIRKGQAEEIPLDKETVNLLISQWSLHD